MKLIVFLLSAFVIVAKITAESNRNISTHIVGGKLSKSKQFTYQVHLDIRITYFMSSLCGGSLISKNHVLTAAHCLYMPKIEIRNGKIIQNHNNYVKIYELYATFGLHDLNLKHQSQTIRVSKGSNFIIHSQYNPLNLVNDIALVRLSWPVTFDEYVHPITLPSSRYAGDYSGKLAVASGFGITSDTTKKRAIILKHVTLKVIGNRMCFGAQKTQLCTEGYGGKGTCNGDSGGPLAVEDESGESVIIGITSSGSINCEDGTPSYYTRVSEYLDWIKRNTGDNLN